MRARAGWFDGERRCGVERVCPKCGFRSKALAGELPGPCKVCGLEPGTAGFRDAAPEPSVLKAWAKACLENLPQGSYLAFCALLHLGLLYLALRYSADTRYGSLIDMALVPVHELGHVLFRPFGQFLGILGGSLTQWLAPLCLVGGFVKQRDLYALSAGMIFFGIALNQSYCYMDSSFQMEKYPDMVFVSLGTGEVTHDWQYIFGTLGMYHSYQGVALLTRGAALAILWLAWAFGAWVLWKAWRGVPLSEAAA
jgi:hypothetical protein